MKLKTQLLLVSLLTLALPWAGYQYIVEMDAALRFGQQQSQAATAKAVASRITSEPALLDELRQPQWQQDAGGALYASPLRIDPQLDGYDDEWRYWQQPFRRYAAPQSNASLTLWLGTRGSNLWLFAHAADQHIVYHNPALDELASGDYLVLRTERADGRLRDYILRASAPGSLTALYRDNSGRVRSEPRIRAQWQERSDGFQLEVRLPRNLPGERLGLAWVNRDTHHDSRRQPNGLAPRPAASEWLGNIGPGDPPPWWLTPSDDLQRAIEVFARDGLQLQLLAPNQAQVALAGALSAPADVAAMPAWKRYLYNTLLHSSALLPLPEDEQPGFLRAPETARALQQGEGAQWYLQGQRRLGRVAEAVQDNDGNIVGAVSVAQGSDRLLAVTDSAALSLLVYALGATLVAAVALLFYASLLSWRIGRLSRQVAHSVDEGGKIRGDFSPSRSGDEIGELSRHYHQMLQRLQQYNEYLRTLASKLSHELRTPLAVIRSSLDNLGHEPQSEQGEVYARRALEGSERLSAILTAMSSASRVEEAIRQAETETLPLAPLLRNMAGVYEALLQGQQLQLLVDPSLEDVQVEAAPELLVQMLDKLMDNAIDYCPSGHTIQLSLQADSGGMLLQVSNDGPLLPDTMQGQLFESLVSVREGTDKDGRLHLGLGLHIVRLIAEFHGATVEARNREDRSGVEFNINFARGVSEPG